MFLLGKSEERAEQTGRHAALACRRPLKNDATPVIKLIIII